MNIHKEALDTLETRFRTTFINSLAGFRQAVLIGTRSKSGITNLAIFNSIIHLGANPPLFGFVSRPDSVQRDTLKNIFATGEYTFNYIKTGDYIIAHQTSARYNSEISEFEMTGFKSEYIAPCLAPFTSEAIVKVAMKFEQKIDIELNGTVLIIGSIQQVIIPEHLVGKDGFVDLEAADTVVSCGLDAYYKTQLLGRLSYAKPDTWPVIL